jgi:tetratricopeptide (TPR) repeat protein
MKASLPLNTNDPCLPIQADLSAMLDGELDAAVVRRVMVHSDACPSCSAFLKSIRNQARAHRELATCQLIDSVVAEREVNGDAVALRRRLLDNQRQLAKVLYELGRGFVLMGVDPSFSRIVAREPVPVPDMCLRGRNLLDEVERLSTREQIHVGQEWVRAKVLFRQRDLRDPVENLAKGRRLLRETLLLWDDYHEARIYLGHAYQVEGKIDRAIIEFTWVLDRSRNIVTRAFALENLGNLHLEEGRFDEAIGLFMELVASGVMDQEPRFHTTYFNLALAHGFKEEFLECERWLRVLDEKFPHKRRVMADEFEKRVQFADFLRGHPEALSHFAEQFPAWFKIEDGR